MSGLGYLHRGIAFLSTGGYPTRRSELIDVLGGQGSQALLAGLMGPFPTECTGQHLPQCATLNGANGPERTVGFALEPCRAGPESAVPSGCRAGY
jgi:hypothetical protein